jgi:hypothetical protein
MLEDQLCTEIWWGKQKERDHMGDKEVDTVIVLY